MKPTENAHMNTYNGTLTITYLIPQDKQAEATLKVVEKEYFREQNATFPLNKLFFYPSSEIQGFSNSIICES